MTSWAKLSRQEIAKNIRKLKVIKFLKNMVKEILIPKENKAQIEEIREVENKELEQNKGSKVIEKLEETVLPTAHASDSEEQKEGAKQVLGWELATADKFAPPVGIAASAVEGVGGAVTEGVGKMIGNEDVKDTGEVLKEAPAQPLKDAGKAIKKIFE